MVVLFCCEPTSPREPDSMFADEFEAAKKAGVSVGLIDFDSLVRGGDPDKCVRRLEPSSSETTAVYRGWMMRPDHYTSFHDAAASRGYRLIADPLAYRVCHLFPNSYGEIRDRTPESVWIPE